MGVTRTHHHYVKRPEFGGMLTTSTIVVGFSLLTTRMSGSDKNKKGMWSEDEHDRFLQALQSYPQGPWRLVAQHVGTRTVRQVQTHAQKYYEKIGRHLRGLRKERRDVIRSEHRIDGIPPGLQLPGVNLGMLSADALSNQGSEGKEEGSDDDVYPYQLSGTTASGIDMNAQLPSLEESLDILLHCLSEE